MQLMTSLKNDESAFESRGLSCMATQMATNSSLSEFSVNSYIRGYHAYMHAWNPSVGEQLPLEREPNNPHDCYCVAVKNDSVVGHLPYNLAPTVSAFLSRPTNFGMAEVTGSKVNRGGGYGLEIPCRYTFYGPKNYMDKLKSVCNKLISDRLL